MEILTRVVMWIIMNTKVFTNRVCTTEQQRYKMVECVVFEMWSGGGCGGVVWCGAMLKGGCLLLSLFDTWGGSLGHPL